MSSYEQKYKEYAVAVEKELESLLTDFHDSVVTQAMRYSLLGGGKRLRGCLVLATFDALAEGEGKTGMRRDALLAASAIEMVHAYSLIHDDLPCMDDDDMRRGKPSCHVEYGEDIALLAGDGLLTMAFETLGMISDPVVLGRCVSELSRASGRKGMIFGQELDLKVPSSERDIDKLAFINSFKTGELINAAVRMGFFCSGSMDDKLEASLYTYSSDIGRAFQITDDILDIVSSSDVLGKPVGSDEKNDKKTYASILGTDEAYSIAKELTEHAVAALEEYDQDLTFLKTLAEKMLIRKK